MIQKPTIEQTTIWILEVLEEERQREPDWLKCRPASQVLGELKDKHGVEDSDITKGVNFCFERNYVDSLNREDGMALRLTADGLRMLGTIQQCRLNELKSKKWERRDKIALASLLLSIFTFVAGLRIGEQKNKADSNTPPPQATNSLPAKSP